MTTKACGTYAGDIAAAASIETKFSINYAPLPPAPRGTANWVNNWEAFDGMVLAISFKSKNGIEILGSAVLVGIGVALTAKHVFDDHLEDLAAGSIAASATGITPTGVTWWVVRQLIPSAGDLLLLRLDLHTQPADSEFSVACLSTRTPSMGETVTIAGFRAGTASLIETGGVLIHGQMRVGAGEVSDVYHVQRDCSMLTSPSFAVKCLAVGGMSGGAVYDDDGLLLGVLSSSFGEDTDGPAFATMLWPALLTPIETAWLPGMIEFPTTLISMAKANAAWVDRPEVIRLLDNGQTTYEPWVTA